MNQERLYFQVNGAFVTYINNSNERCKVETVSVKVCHTIDDILLFAHYIPSERHMDVALKQQKEISELLGGVQVDIVRIVEKPVVEVVKEGSQK